MKNKLRTMKSRPEVSEEEIQQYMNFEKLLLEKDRYVKKQKMFRWGRNIAISAGAITLIAVMYVMITPGNERTDIPNTAGYTANETQDISHDQAEAQADSTMIPPDEKPSKSIDRGNQEQKSKTKPIAGNRDDNKAPDLPVKGENNNESKPSSSVYNQAVPVNGYPDLYAYFERELTYPEEVVKDSLEGVVTVIFTINTEGKPENILVENSLGPAFDIEVHRVIENMPPWNPASYNGKPMKSKVSIPLTFELKKTD